MRNCNLNDKISVLSNTKITSYLGGEWVARIEDNCSLFFLQRFVVRVDPVL